MKAEPTEKLVSRIKGSFARFESRSVSWLLSLVVPEASLSSDNLLILARRLAEPSWSRLAIRDLDNAGMFALRLLAQLPHGASPRDLDTIARLATKQVAGDKSPTQQLLDAGIALTTAESAFRRTPQTKVKVIGPLRERWLTLVPAPTERFDLPELSPAEVLHREVRGEFELGVFLAVMEHLRPRATRVSDIHRGDEKVIVEKLSGLLGGEAATRDRIRWLLRVELLLEDDGRIRLDRHALKTWLDPLAMLLLRKLEGSRHSTTWRALLGHLTLSSGWRSYADFLEVGALAAFEPTYAYDPLSSTMAELDSLLRMPGVLSQEFDGQRWIRVSANAMKALEGDIVPRTFGTALLIQPNMQIVAQPGTPLSVLASLGAFCRLVSADQVAVFALDENAAKRAASEGWSATEILTLLEQHSAHGVPSTVARALTDWVRTRTVATIAFGLVALIDLPLAEVRQLAGKSIRVEELKPGVFHTDSEHGPKLIAALRKAHVACRVFGPAAEEDDDDGIFREDRDMAPELQLRKLTEQAMKEVARLRRVPED